MKEIVVDCDRAAVFNIADAARLAEAMMAIVLADALLRHRGQNIDVQCDTPVLPGSAD